MSNPYTFSLEPQLSLQLERIGNEGEPVLIIEGVLSEPDSLVDYAAREVTFAPVAGPAGGYPGLRAPAPLNYVNQLVRRLDPLVQRAFGLAGARLCRAECSLSIVTLRPDELAPLQRVPHVDTVDPMQFAVLHYLCLPDRGGTAFYRHRATGFEVLTAERQAEYAAHRKEELKREVDDLDYIRGDHKHFAQTAAFESRFNRVIVYRSRTLHSGQIPQGADLSQNPRDGRLTANIFVNYRVAG